MSQRAVEHCLGRLITDTQFRRLARSSLAQACHQFGYDLTLTEIELLGHLDFTSLADISRRLDLGLHRVGGTLDQ